MNANTAIVVEGIAKSYGNFRAVDDLTFDVRCGEIFALLGPNGSGKTTTIRMILDILKPDAGQIAVLGAAITDSTKERIGYLPEERGLYQGVPVIDIMIYLGRLKGMPEHQARKHSMELLDRLELAEHAKKKIGELSKGMQQKIQFAVTVLHQPELIIIDEPFSGLDPINTLVIKALLKEMRNNGIAIVMSTHQMNQVEEMADRMLMIHQGRQQLYGAVDDIRKQYALHAIVVEGEGDWAALPGVESVSANENERNGTLLQLAETATPDDILGAIAASPDYRIERFERAVPSLNEIFIRVVEEQK
ncbi:MAG: ATP-binding cassette domain-containing protein [Chloroflexi bacterium]|nr:MAG: sodium ABC transporter [Phototrophicales bacterium]RMF79885.1 MAG: ATP-binding cassette domain-containing protein [Chloroflexota bacterium]